MTNTTANTTTILFPTDDELKRMLDKADRAKYEIDVEFLNVKFPGCKFIPSLEWDEIEVFDADGYHKGEIFIDTAESNIDKEDWIFQASNAIHDCIH